jgi:hypothetical protein
LLSLPEEDSRWGNGKALHGRTGTVNRRFKLGQKFLVLLFLFRNGTLCVGVFVEAIEEVMLELVF